MANWSLEYDRFYEPSERVIRWDMELRENHKYPKNVIPLTIEYARSCLNTKVSFDIVEDKQTGEPLCYNVIINDYGNKSSAKYVGLTQQLLETVPLIDYDEKDNTINLGYVKCDIVGYVSLPYQIYVLRIRE